MQRTPLRTITNQIEQQFSAGEYAQAVELLSKNPLAAWFGFSTERFQEIIGELDRQCGETTPFIRAMSMLFASGGGAPSEALGGELDLDATDAPNAPTPEEKVTLIARSFGLRLQGRPVEALQYSTVFSRHAGGLQPLFDSSGGWGLFYPLQHGATAMLAGQFVEALDCFTRARMHVMVPSLAFFTRDACVKQAMVHAAYGDPETAQALLDEADLVPRTESWAEGLLDAGAAIARALLPTDRPQESLRELEHIPLNEVGEMWPFYVLAVFRALLALGDVSGAEQRLAMFARFPLPRVEGQGFSGSVLPLSAAMIAMRQGDLIEARRHLEGADGGIAVTRVVTAVLEVCAGRPADALRLTRGLHEATRRLRGLELWRLAVLAGAHLALGMNDDCAHVLDFALGLPGGLREYEVGYFSGEVREFAAAHVDGWPAGDGVTEWFPVRAEALTGRELEVLRALSRGKTRDEIAQTQFVSLNTVKAHIRAIYRKLGVRSRAAAVLEAERRGLL